MLVRIFNRVWISVLYYRIEMLEDVLWDLRSSSPAQRKKEQREVVIKIQKVSEKILELENKLSRERIA